MHTDIPGLYDAQHTDVSYAHLYAYKATTPKERRMKIFGIFLSRMKEPEYDSASYR